MFVAREMGAAGIDPTEQMVFDAVMEWKNRRKSALDEGAVATTIRSLTARNWLAVQPSANLPLPDFAQIYA